MIRKYGLYERRAHSAKLHLYESSVSLLLLLTKLHVSYFIFVNFSQIYLEYVMKQCRNFW